MRGINKVIILGNLGQDPELRQAGSNPVCSFSVATTEKWKDKNTGEQREATEWHRIVIWGRLGEIAAQYLHKGSKVYLEGQLKTRKWQDKEGQDRYTTEVVCSEMQMLDPPQQAQQPANHNGYQQPQPPQRQAAQQPYQPRPPSYETGGIVDDVPF